MVHNCGYGGRDSIKSKYKNIITRDIILPYLQLYEIYNKNHARPKEAFI